MFFERSNSASLVKSVLQKSLRWNALQGASAHRKSVTSIKWRNRPKKVLWSYRGLAGEEM
jgi:hypothetical protein